MPDELTGLPTHRDLVASQSGRVAMLVDVDGMIWVNDQFGHEEGDRALARVARVVSELLSTDASVFRVGGDEFLAVFDRELPSISGVASAIVERIGFEEIPYRRTDRKGRARLDVNVVVLNLTSDVLNLGFGKNGITTRFGDWMAGLVYDEKMRHGGLPGVIVDARSTPWRAY